MWAITCLQGLAYKSKINMPIDKPQQMVFGNVILEPKVVQQRLGTCVVTHHDKQRASAEVRLRTTSRTSSRDVLGPAQVTKTLANCFVLLLVAGLQMTLIACSVFS